MTLICMLSLTGCGMTANKEDTKITANEISQTVVKESAVSVNLDDVASQCDPSEQYCDYLKQIAERTFTDEKSIESAEATVLYDEGTEQYSIELSLKTNGKIDNEKIEDYKTYLRKTYAGVIVVIDGEVCEKNFLKIFIVIHSFLLH